MLYLKLLNGPEKGKVFPINKSPMIIGRANADIILKRDSKVSSQHAEITEENGGFVVYDLDSRNGVKIDSKAFPRIILQKDLIFQIGKHKIKVIERKVKRSDPPQKLQNQPLKNDSQKGALNKGKEPSPQPKSPQEERKPSHNVRVEDKFLNVLKSMSKDYKNDLNSKLQAFSRKCVLTYTKGLQISDRIVLEYGPRSFGLSIMEFPIYDRKAPDFCFHIFEADQKIYFYTPHPDIVLYNGKSEERNEVKDNDRININQIELVINLQPLGT